MKIPAVVAILSIAVQVASVNPCLSATAARSSVRDLATRLLNSGDDDRFPGAVAAFLGIAQGIPLKTDGVEAKDCEDGRDHEVFLMLDGTSKPPRATGFYFKTHEKKAGVMTSYFMKTGLDGSLSQVVRNTGKLDAAGKPVAGSGVTTSVSVSKATRKMLRYELDFWLKGMHRKKS